MCFLLHGACLEQLLRAVPLLLLRNGHAAPQPWKSSNPQGIAEQTHHIWSYSSAALCSSWTALNAQQGLGSSCCHCCSDSRERTRDLWPVSKELLSDCSAGFRLDARKNRGTIQQPFPGMPPPAPSAQDGFTPGSAWLTWLQRHSWTRTLQPAPPRSQDPPACTSLAAKAEGKMPKLSFPTSRGKVQKVLIFSCLFF